MQVFWLVFWWMLLLNVTTDELFKRFQTRKHRFNVSIIQIRWDSFRIHLNWTKFNSIQLNWTKFNSIQLNWTKFNWIQLNWTELNWTELNWTELNWTELNWIVFSFSVRSASVCVCWVARAQDNGFIYPPPPRHFDVNDVVDDDNFQPMT